MKNLLSVLLLLLFCGAAIGQSITLSGGCISTPVTLTQVTNPALRNGKVHYKGTAVINIIPDGPVSLPVEVYWLGDNDNVWVITYEHQAFYESSADTPRPPGSASTNFSWIASEPSLCGAAGAPANLSVTGPDVVLWVSFGTIDTYIKNNTLHVNWTTEKEVNNDHFEIEASTDGQQFVTIGTIKSKAENGNSDVVLNYEWTANGDLRLEMLPLIAVVLVLLLFVRRKKAIWVASVVIGLTAVTHLSCKKDKDTVSDAENYYIRIAQIDKDGTKTYSKVVRVNGE